MLTPELDAMVGDEFGDVQRVAVWHMKLESINIVGVVTRADMRNMRRGELSVNIRKDMHTTSIPFGVKELP